MMLVERYLVTAKRLDNGELATGYLVPMWGQLHIVNPSDENTAYPIDSDTVEPVAVPIIATPHPTPGYGDERRCPNCNAWFNEVRRVGDTFYGSTPYCGNCGQRLDWSAALQPPDPPTP